MCVLLLLIYLVLFFYCYFSIRFFSVSYILYFYSIFIFLSLCLISCELINIISYNYIFFVEYWTIIHIGELKITSSFYYDVYSIWIIWIICFISSVVQIYSIEYMRADLFFFKFLSLLLLFTFFMLFFVMSANFLLLFVGWEGVGLTSYLLINYWDSRINATKAALKAILMNKISDFFLYFAILLLCVYMHTVSFFLVLGLNEYYNKQLLFLLGFCILLGAAGKSAQFGLHTWLPDAMEGPTPVSALLHAATMVTAGIFLLIRCSVIFEALPIILIIIIFIGGLTTFFAGSIGCFLTDLKRIIAFSTCSQLGLMFLIYGYANHFLSFFHLINHAYFKALLFLCAGLIIHALFEEQDLRKLGGLSNFLPLTYLAIIIGGFSISGFPFTTGFYSKDSILEFVFVHYITVHSTFIYFLSSSSVIFTCFYSLKILFLVFWNTPNILKNSYYIEETFTFMIYVIIFLTIGSYFCGYLYYFLFVDNIRNFDSYDYNFLYQIDFIPKYLTWIHYIPILLGFIGLFFFIILYYIWIWIEISYLKFLSVQVIVFFLAKFGWFFSLKWFVDYIYNIFFVKKILVYSRLFFINQFDKGLLEYFGAFTLVVLFQTYYSNFSKRYFYLTFVNFYFFIFSIWFFFLYCSLFFDIGSFIIYLLI